MKKFPDEMGLKSHFQRQIEYYNENRMHEYVSDLADNVVYVISPSETIYGKREVVTWYEKLSERFESWRWESNFEYRVEGYTGLAIGPFTQVSKERGGKEVRHSGVTMVVFTYGERGWTRVAENMRFET